MGKKSSPAAPAPIKIDPWETAESQYEFGKSNFLKGDKSNQTSHLSNFKRGFGRPI